MKKLVSIFLFLCFELSLAAELDKNFLIKTNQPFKRALSAHSLSLSDWTKTIDKEGFDLLCLGESHNEFFRDFYSKKVLPYISSNILALETVPEQAEAFRQNYVEQVEDVSLLGAPLKNILDAHFGLNPQSLLIGIEQTKEEAGLITFAKIKQITEKNDEIMSRDGFIAQHLDQYLEEGQDRIISLYGRLHCSKFSNPGFGFAVPFFRLLMNKHKSQKKLLAVKVVTEKNKTSAIRSYAKEFDLMNEDLVIENGSEIDPKDYNYNLALFNLFQSYDVVIIPKKSEIKALPISSF